MTVFSRRSRVLFWACIAMLSALMAIVWHLYSNSNSLSLAEMIENTAQATFLLHPDQWLLLQWKALVGISIFADRSIATLLTCLILSSVYRISKDSSIYRPAL